jgi:PAS domain S-box-containing protein
LKETLVQPTGRERTWGDEELIVSKTDLKGIITYANRTFLSVAGYTEQEILGKPHSIIRHPDMPRCVFKLLWDTIESGNEIFAYVKNMAKNGDHYWVFAHVTPTLDAHGNIIGYHANRAARTGIRWNSSTASTASCLRKRKGMRIGARVWPPPARCCKASWTRRKCPTTT